MLILMVIVFFVVVSYLYSGLYLLMRPLLQKSSANLRAIVLLLTALGAPLISLISVFAFVLPSSLPSLYKHCHVSLCEPHVPAFFESTHYLLSLALVLIVLTLLIIFLNLKQQKSLNIKIQNLFDLVSDSENIVQKNYLTIVDSSVPLIMNIGLLKPKIVISSHTSSSLTKSSLKLVLMYELMRCKHYDNLRARLAKISTWLWPKSIKNGLLADLNNASHEAICRQIKEAQPNQGVEDQEHIRHLPKYIQQLFGSLAKRDEGQATSAASESTIANPISLALVALQYFFVMVSLTSLTHYLSDQFF